MYRLTLSMFVCGVDVYNAVRCLEIRVKFLISRLRKIRSYSISLFYYQVTKEEFGTI